MEKVILIVENDPKGLKLVRDLLHVLEYTTLEATDGEQGVEIAKKNKPDLILMDILMPVMGGLEATKILKADNETKDIPIVALTALAMSEEEGRIHQVGCDGYITKPIDITWFLKSITDYL